ncbi:MAG: hypothetical protein ABI901_17255, partial [Roseiflexaceae bacterium]
KLTVDEREELAAVMRSLVTGIDRTLREVGQTVKTVSGVAMPFDGMLDDNEDIRDVLEYISESLTGSSLTTRNDSEHYEMASLPPATEREPGNERRPQQRDLRRNPRSDPREAGYYENEGRRRRQRPDDYER